MPFSQNLSDKIRDKLAHKVVVPLVGPSSVGKTTIMRAVVAADPEFYRSSGFTTRDLRDGEEPDTYRFLPNTPEQRNAIVKQFENGELIQFAIHPTTGYLYGTSLEDYSGKYNLLDVLSSEVANFRSLGFASCQTIMIVATPDDWQTRFASREFSDDENHKRILEGIASLTWGLDQGNGVRWVENKDDDIRDTVSHVIAIAKNQLHENDERARDIANQLLKYLIGLSR